MPHRILMGDLFESEAATLVNAVNCVGVMGKGIAQLFKERYPAMFADYKARCDRNEVRPGVPYLYRNALGSSILNFPTKNHWRSPALLKDVIHGLDIFVDKYQEWGIESIAFPSLGCGNGGLAWEVVGPIMHQKLSQLDIAVEIYTPYGTKGNH
jgi:O-acetyl-ADP-ribose deacetylase (regulator of RNase III)